MSLHAPSKGFHGGAVSEVDRHNAAKLITAGSHRLAEEDEIAAYLAAMGNRKAEIAAAHRAATIDRLGFNPADIQPPTETKGKK